MNEEKNSNLKTITQKDDINTPKLVVNTEINEKEGNCKQKDEMIQLVVKHGHIIDGSSQDRVNEFGNIDGCNYNAHRM